MGDLIQKRMKGKANTKGFDKNPKNINRKGQPRKGISFVNEQLEEKGYKPATKQDIEMNYMQMLQLEEQELKAMSEGQDRPMLIRILAKNMLGGKSFDIIEKMLDRGIGKAIQKSELTGANGGPVEIKKVERSIMDNNNDTKTEAN